MKPKQQAAVIERLAQSQLEKERKLWMNKCIMAITASYAADLMDKWDWTPDMVSTLLQSAETNFENMLEKLVTVDDFVKWVKERGINIKMIE
jgi:uncharacterized membrane protein YheB (UPF0754 family)